MLLHHESLPPRLVDDALAATLWFDPDDSTLRTLRSLLAPGAGGQPLTPSRPGAASTLLRRAVLLAPAGLRPYFAVCALEAWRRVPVRQLAGWSGIPWSALKYQLATRRLTPAGIAAWNLALHAAWLLDVADLPANVVVSCMHLGRPAGLAAVLGARGIRFSTARVEPGAFAGALERYLTVLRAAFRR